MVLGQEQDNLGSNFTASEAFIGSISQVNIWNYELNPQLVQEMSKHADHHDGNVVSWPDFIENADDGVVKVVPSKARKGNAVKQKVSVQSEFMSPCSEYEARKRSYLKFQIERKRQNLF